MGCVRAAVTSDVLDPAAHFTLVHDEHAGAVASFIGTIRDHDPEAQGEVIGIDYSYHPDAEQLLQQITAELLAELDPRDEAKVAVSHRVGGLAVGDLALVCVVSTPHRGEAFTICQQLVERIKAQLPIWKQQFEADGRQVWSRLGLAEDL